MLQTTTRADPALALPTWFINFRQHMGWTQRQMAEAINATTGSVQKYEYGKQMPSGSTLLLLSMLAERYGFEPPPILHVSRGPRTRRI
jgi:transcriptional regulator with XRE-family HTH domain